MLGANKKILYNRTRCAYKVEQILKRRTMINQLLNNNLSDYIIQIAQKTNAKEQLQLLLLSLFGSVQQEKQEEAFYEKPASSLVVFTKKELSEMPQKFSKLFKVGKIRAHVIRRKDGLYLIRCQINKVRISVAASQLDYCKERFIEKLHEKFEIITLNGEKKGKKGLTPLVPYMEAWLESSKKPFIKENTYIDYVRMAKAYILPVFKGKYIERIRALELQSFLTDISNSGRSRTAKKVYQLLSSMFDFAIADGIITLNPIAKVKVARYESEHGVPLTREEEFTLLQELKRNPTVYNQAYAFILYTGLRRSELATLTVDEQWVSVVTAKQRKGMKEKSRSIPISPMLKQVLPLIDIEAIKAVSLNPLTNHFKDIFPTHHLHDLRHTFITRAQECEIRREIVSLWAGHRADSSITTTVHTHFQERSELQIQEMEKYHYEYK